MSVTDFGDPHQVIHIPARDLTGTREAKLADLDMFLAQLQVVRLALCGQAVRLEGLNGAAGQRLRPRHRLWSWPATRLRAIFTDETKITRAGKPVTSAVTAQKDEKVAVVVDHDKPGDEAIHVRFEAAK